MTEDCARNEDTPGAGKDAPPRLRWEDVADAFAVPRHLVAPPVDAGALAGTALRGLIAKALFDADGCVGWDSVDPHIRARYGKQADAVLAVVLPTTRILSSLARSANDDVKRVISLYEVWLAAGPPPLGTSVSRWWDARLAELRNVLSDQDRDGEACSRHPLAPVIGGMCGGCTVYPPDMTKGTEEADR